MDPEHHHVGSELGVEAGRDPALRGAAGAAVVTLLGYLVAQQWWSPGQGAFLVVPVLYALAGAGAFLVAFLLTHRARAFGEETLRWAVVGFVIAGTAALLQGLTVGGVAEGDPFATTPSGGAALYLLWHAALAAAALGGIVCPGAVRARRLTWVLGLALVAVTLWEPRWMPLPPLVDAQGAFLPLYRWLLMAALALSLAATAVWVWRCGRRPSRPDAWVTVSLALATLDLAVGADASRFYEAVWWSTAPLRTAQFLVPACGLLGDFARVLHALRRHQRSLVERLSDELEAPPNSDATVTAQREVSATRERVQGVLDASAFDIAFQPIYSLATGQLVGAEALTRFETEPYEPPNVWFDRAHAVGLGVELELAALREALRAVEQLPDGTYLSLNLSPSTVGDPRLAWLLGQAARRRLVVEITEHAAVDDYERLLTELARLRRLGIRLAVDDAGAGFASLRHVVRLRPDLIKLDLSLTRGLEHDPVQQALATALADFAGKTGTVLVAEGVETAGELRAWQQLGAQAVQGYLLGRPGPLPCPARSPHWGGGARVAARRVPAGPTAEAAPAVPPD